MTISSQQMDYSTISNNPITITGGITSPSYYTITNPGVLTGTYGAGTTTYTVPVTGGGLTGSTANVTITNGGAGSITINPFNNGSTWTTAGFNTSYIPKEDFVDAMPDLARINDMCEKYPGMKIAFEKFKTTYNLIKADYDGEKSQK